MTPAEANVAARIDRSWMGEAGQVFGEAEDRLDALLLAGVNPWPSATAMAAKGLGVALETLRLGACGSDLAWARVATAPEHAGRFALAQKPAGEHAALLALNPTGYEPADAAWPCDVLAVALGRDRFWRLTLVSKGVCEAPERAFAGETLRLYQNARAYLADLIRWRAHERRRREAGEDAYERVMRPARLALGCEDIARPMRTPQEPERAAVFWPAWKAAHAAKIAAIAALQAAQPGAPPAGVLVLDPTAFSWTKRGWLKGIETVEILDAPATGPLGRALQKLNPMIGSPRGVWLTGTETSIKPPRRITPAMDLRDGRRSAA